MAIQTLQEALDTLNTIQEVLKDSATLTNTTRHEVNERIGAFKEMQEYLESLADVLAANKIPNDEEVKTARVAEFLFNEMTEAVGVLEAAHGRLAGMRVIAEQFEGYLIVLMNE